MRMHYVVLTALICLTNLGAQDDEIVVHLQTEKLSKFVLAADTPKILWVPPNHANGFMNLRDNTVVLFFSTATMEDTRGDDIRFPYNKWDIWQKDYR